MTVGYYESLPPELVTPQTQINRAMALVREAVAQNSSGNVDAAFKNFGEAQTTFEKLHAAGDTSEAVTYGLALVLYSEGFNSIVGMTGRGTVADVARASDLLRPLVAQTTALRRVRQLYADALNILSLTQPMEKAVATCDEARKVLATLGALDLSDLNAASSYADTGDSEARHLLSLGRVAEAQKLEQEVYDLTEKILTRRPSDLHALSDRTFAAQLLGTLANRQHDAAAAADYAIKAAKAGEDEVRFNPSDLGAWQRWTLALGTGAEFQFERGEIADAIATMQTLLALEQDKRRPSSLGPVIWYHWLDLAVRQAQTGDSAAAAVSLKSFLRDSDERVAQFAPGAPGRQILATANLARASLELSEGQTQAAWVDATAVINNLDSVKIAADDTSSTIMRDNILAGNLGTAARAAMRLGRYAQSRSTGASLAGCPAERDIGCRPESQDIQCAIRSRAFGCDAGSRGRSAKHTAASTFLLSTAAARRRTGHQVPARLCVCPVRQCTDLDLGKRPGKTRSCVERCRQADRRRIGRGEEACRHARNIRLDRGRTHGTRLTRCAHMSVRKEALR